MIKRYIKKPIEIEAIQFTDESKNQVYSWAKEIQNNVSHSWSNGNPCLVIPTSEGDMKLEFGDFLIKEPFPTNDRRLYPCKKDVFEKTYSSYND